ncbi:nicotinate phosphoribosyltransferase [Actinosynnema sp. NPDC049800]
MTALCTDFYEIRMAVSFLRRGMAAPATFSLFARRLPVDRGFLVAAGLADCLDFLEEFRFTNDELDYVDETVGLDRATRAALAELRFTGEVRAVPEGRVVFAGEPLLEVTAPIAQAQLVETALLNFVTFQTAVATKAARCRIAAGDAGLIDFAARRTHGLEAANAVARASAIAGFDATSYVAAARRYGLVPAGTMAHSYVEAFPDERSAFRAFAEDFPDDAVLLVDTYDTPSGVRNAVDVARPVGIRLDSGDLPTLSRRARQMLDTTGLRDARIVVSGGLDEHGIADLVARGAPVDVFGVGTRMGVSADAPSLDTAYKLVEYDGRPVMKLSSGKVTAPGAKQVFRGPVERGDVIGLREEPLPADHEPLLVPVVVDGRRTGPRRSEHDAVHDARTRCYADLDRLPATALALRSPRPVAVRHSERLTALTERVRRELEGHRGVAGLAGW